MESTTAVASSSRPAASAAWAEARAAPPASSRWRRRTGRHGAVPVGGGGEGRRNSAYRGRRWRGPLSFPAPPTRWLWPTAWAAPPGSPPPAPCAVAPWLQRQLAHLLEEGSRPFSVVLRLQRLGAVERGRRQGEQQGDGRHRTSVARAMRPEGDSSSSSPAPASAPLAEPAATSASTKLLICSGGTAP